jgi:hypothetical protein
VLPLRADRNPDKHQTCTVYRVGRSTSRFLTLDGRYYNTHVVAPYTNIDNEIPNRGFHSLAKRSRPSGCGLQEAQASSASTYVADTKQALRPTSYPYSYAH